MSSVKRTSRRWSRFSEIQISLRLAVEELVRERPKLQADQSSLPEASLEAVPYPRAEPAEWSDQHIHLV